ncbi:MAG: flagellar biosynthesis protein FlhA [Clostridiaceae bacterium]|nr:flagellar biosynthesis protein FlhA [Clostridiaceae bacterium]
MKFKSIAIAIWAVAIILVILIPLPPTLVDVLLILNITLSIIILLNSVYAQSALEMSAFPTLILFTTLFRVAMNVASTRLIIGQGNAGKVIENFGKFVGGNNIVVGAIIFLVIMIVQFLVITKGAERVAEVSARFTLDAMPGKQMAVDADLNSGLISESQARERRNNIQREADFYGSMDGASKFIKNDAIFGFITVALNVIGGFIMGMMGNPGASALDILEQYTILTIGDGLVSQIPALLISFATGIIVTRAASEDDLSDEIISQLFSNPKVLYATAGACFLMTFIIGRFFMIIVSILLLFLGSRLQSEEKKMLTQDETDIEEQQVEEIRKPENVISLLHVDPIELEFGYGVIPLADVNQGGDLLDRVVMIRRQLALELGMIVPVIRLRDNIQLNPNQYVIKIKGVEVATGELLMDHFMAMNPGTAEDEIDGIPTHEPAFGLPAIWINESQRDRAEMLGYTVVDPPSVISTHMTEVIKRHAHELLSRQDVQTLLDNVKTNYPAVVEDLVPKQLSLGEVQKVLCNLLREGVSIRDLVTILETLSDYASFTRESDVLTEYVRQGLGRAISMSFITPDNSDVITLDPELERMILDSVQKTEMGSYLAIEPSVTNKILKNLSTLIERITQLGKQPIVLASPMVRLYFKRLTEQSIPGLVVLSYNELEPSTEVRSIGMVTY